MLHSFVKGLQLQILLLFLSISVHQIQLCSSSVSNDLTNAEDSGVAKNAANVSELYDTEEEEHESFEMGKALTSSARSKPNFIKETSSSGLQPTASARLNYSKLVLVSTIDGKLSAFSLEPSSGDSHLKWQFDLGTPLLSQSISQLLHRDASGQPYRIIPSLDGSLFRLDSDSLHSLPVTADTLLSTSYRLAEDTFVVGSKETLLTGLSLSTGQPLYQCGTSGCKNLAPDVPSGGSDSSSTSTSGRYRHHLDDGVDDDNEVDDEDDDDRGRHRGDTSSEPIGSASEDAGVLTVRRLTSTVRAVHSSGREDWHFQVAECELGYHACANQSGGDPDDGRGSSHDGDSQARRFCAQSGGFGGGGNHRQQKQPKDSASNDRGSAVSQSLRFDVTSGIVYQIDSKTGAVLWRQSLASPIAQAWELTSGGSRPQLRPISVFHMRDSASAVATSTTGGGCPRRDSRLPSSLSGGRVYIGQYRDQYYVQSEPHYRQHQQLKNQLAVSPAAGHSAVWRRQPPPSPQLQVLLEYKPSDSASGTGSGGGRGELALREDFPVAEPGFYRAIGWDGVHGNGNQGELAEQLPTHPPYGQHSNAGGDDFIGDFDDDDDGVVYQVINNYTGSLWHYLPQIIILSLFLSVLVHLFVTKVLHRARYEQLNRVCSIESNVSSSNTLASIQKDAQLLLATPEQQQQQQQQQQQLSGVAASTASMTGSLSAQQQQQQQQLGLPSYLPGIGGQFVSRYHTEFTHVRCLGRGGFGLVFEACHRIDDCSYAIKRVAVRNSDQARARILREVKALAKLDHQGIVRYYQAWFECPPCGWQERMDASLINAAANRNEDADVGATSGGGGGVGGILDDALSLGAPDTVASFGLSSGGAADFNDSKFVAEGSRRFNSSRRKRLFSDSFAAINSGVGASRRRRRHGTGNGSGGGSISSCCVRRPSPLNPYDGDVDLSASEDDADEINDRNVDDVLQSVEPADFDEDFDSGEFSNVTSGCEQGGATDSGANLQLGSRWLMPEGDTTTDGDASVGPAALLNKRPASKPKRDQENRCKTSNKSKKNNNSLPNNNRTTAEDDSVEIVFEYSNPEAAYNRLSSESAESDSPSASETDEDAAFSKKSNGAVVERGRRRQRRKTTNASSAALSAAQQNPVYEPKLYLYIQMQLCQKESLRDWLRVNTGERDRARVRDVFSQICQAVSFVHQCNLIHRDLKSSNIFFALDGSVKIGDFGLATALMDEEAAAAAAAAAAASCAHPAGLHTAKSVATAASAAAATWHTSEIGTRLYMSPEQSAGLAYNEKVDIFSLGLILFELCQAFTTEMERVTCMLRAKECRLPEKFLTDWPSESAMALRLLSANPADRPSAEEILADLLSLMSSAGEACAAGAGRSRTSSSQSSSVQSVGLLQRQQRLAA